MCAWKLFDRPQLPPATASSMRVECETERQVQRRPLYASFNAIVGSARLGSGRAAQASGGKTGGRAGEWELLELEPKQPFIFLCVSVVCCCCCWSSCWAKNSRIGGTSTSISISSRAQAASQMDGCCSLQLGLCILSL